MPADVSALWQQICQGYIGRYAGDAIETQIDTERVYCEREYTATAGGSMPDIESYGHACGDKRRDYASIERTDKKCGK